jgi:AraC-like DNA-binding protein
MLARQIVSELARREIDPDTALRGLGFGLSDLSTSDFRISYAQTSRLIRRAMQLMNQPHPGLAMGQDFNLVTWGVCLLGMMSSRDSHEMLELAIGYLPATDRFLTLERDDANDMFGIVAEARFDDPEIEAFLVENTFASLVRLGRHVTGNGFAPQSVDLRAPAPNGATRHDEVFGCPVRFGQPTARLRFPPEPVPIPTADPVVAKLSREVLEIKRPGERAPSALEEAIVRAIRADLKNPPSVRAVAASLNFSERTLRRRLLESDLSYTRLLDNERMRRAISLLTERRLSLPNVAEEAGFTDARSLRRAIKRWTGRTPTQIRRGDGEAVAA